ncbi:CDA1 Predicted xylanase/chitin deacetylase [Rhabdaerophilaceae bacterium]
MSSLRHSLIGAALRVISATRADRLLGGAFAGRGVILTLHHVRLASDREFAENRLLEISPSFLEALIRLLRDLDYDIIPIGQLKQRLDAAATSRRFAILTFDDGYRDTRDYALPILQSYQAPCVIYAVPGFADRSTPLWWCDLEDVVRARDAIDIDIGGRRLVHPTKTMIEKSAGFRRLYWALRSLPDLDATALVAAMAADSRIDTIGRVARICMDWHELRDVARDPLVTIGAHSLTHPRLKTLSDAEAQREIIASKTRLEEALGQPVHHIAYPVGDRTSAGMREFAFARAAGFETGVTTRPGVLVESHARHLTALPRLSVNGLFQKSSQMRALLSGLPMAIANRGRMLNVD